jgi:dihydrofolate reductase
VSQIAVQMYVTLDGVMAAPQNWSFDFWADELEEYAFERLLAADALLLGRQTYEEFVEPWQSRLDDPFADRMNALPKYVVSNTLEHPEWNATVIDGNVIEQVSRLKQQPGRDLLLYGSRQLFNTLFEHDLIDDLRIWVFPVVAGGGAMLFDHPTRKTVERVGSKTFDTGVVVLEYRPAADPGRSADVVR